MSQEKRDKMAHREGRFGADVYENSIKFNQQIATKGPALLYALTKASDQITNSTIVTGAGGLVLGAIGFFGNRYYIRKGDDSAYSHMGQLVGGIQFTAGFVLLTLKASEIYTDSGEPGPLLNVIKFSTAALTVMQGMLLLVNSYLYDDDTPKAPPVSRPKLD